MKETKDELVKRLLDVKAEQSNLIDLNAYALGLEAMYEAINHTRCHTELCDCAIPNPIDPFTEVDKDTCRKCNNLIA